MAKEETKMDAAPPITTAESLKAAYPELVKQIEAAVQPDPIAAIRTPQQLAAAYPDLVEEIRVATCKLIADQTVEDFAVRFPALYGRLGKSLKPAFGTNLGAVGFALAADDPFAQGVLRLYGEKAGYGPSLQLPAILPFKDPATRQAIESYIVRAAGAGDRVRAAAAKEALAKCK